MTERGILDVVIFKGLRNQFRESKLKATLFITKFILFPVF